MTWQDEVFKGASDLELAKTIVVALETFLERDRKLLEIDVQERTISDQLAAYLRPSFPGWDVDCEYNRKGLEPKTLKIPGRKPRKDGTNLLLPDIIVHHRTEIFGNFLVIEMKKSTNTESDTEDENKLRAFLTQLSYQHGLFVRIGCKEKAGEIIRVWWAEP
jgi:hypothetical protein